MNPFCHVKFWMHPNVDSLFFLHLGIIQKHQCQPNSAKHSLLEISKFLDVAILDLQMSMFKFTMKTQAHKAMVEPFDVNLMTRLCTIINTNGLLIQRLNEYLKLVEITIVLVFRSIQVECTFFTIAFIKDKLQNWLNQHLHTIMCIFT